MPVSRTAASLSLTIGVALATLLVAGGILAGPSILECSRDGGRFGACLRSKAEGAGLVHSRRVDSDPTPSHPDGWIAADATEYAPPPSATAHLAAGGGTLTAGGDAVPLARRSGEAEIATAPGTLTATAETPLASPPAAVVLAAPSSPHGQGAIATANPAVASSDLLAPSGALLAAGTVPAGPSLLANAAVSATPGVMTANGLAAPSTPNRATSVIAAAPGNLGATGAVPSSAPQAVAALSPAAGQVLAGGAVPPAPEPAQSNLKAADPLPVPAATLKAELPALSSLEQVAPQPVLIVPEPVPPATKAPPHRSASIVEKLRPVPKYDPRFPNVIVLPPPNTGADSSITSLELR